MLFQQREPAIPKSSTNTNETRVKSVIEVRCRHIVPSVQPETASSDDVGSKHSRQPLTNFDFVKEAVEKW